MKDKITTIIQHLTFIITVFIAVFVVFWFSMIIQMFDSTTKNVLGDVLFAIIYFVLPIVVFLAALLINLCFKKSAMWAVVLISLYALIAFATNAGVHKYMETFTYDKWAKYPNERELMLDNLTSEYNFMDMSKEEVIDILGDSKAMYADPGNKDILEYKVDEGWLDPVMLSFEFQDNIVVDVYTYCEFREAKQPLY